MLGDNAQDFEYFDFASFQHAIGSMGGGQPLGSPGSCLQYFRAHPYIECNGRGQCHFYSNKYSYWLVNIVNNQTPVQSTTLKAQDQILNSVSKCTVCILNTEPSLPSILETYGYAK